MRSTIRPSRCRTGSPAWSFRTVDPRLDIVFISRSALARDEFAQQLKVVQPGGTVSVRDGLAGDAASLSGAVAVVLDCRGGHLVEDGDLHQLRNLSPAPFVMAVIDNLESAKAWAVKAALDDVLVNPFTLLDLHLRMASMRGVLAQRREISRLAHAAQNVAHETERLRALAYTDHLTGLPNRRYLDKWAEDSAGEAGPFGFQMLDLNGFKQVNDRYGHHVGDMLLRQVSRRVSGISRRLDLVVRLGGDEIAIVQHGAMRAEDCIALASRLLAAFREPFEVEGHVIHVGASIGSALYPQDSSNLLDLMRHADRAMYAAKAGDGTASGPEAGSGGA